jgi:hypothetical protein
MRIQLTWLHAMFTPKGWNATDCLITTIKKQVLFAEAIFYVIRFVEKVD